MENGMQMTLEECMPETFQKPTAGVSDSLANSIPLRKPPIPAKKSMNFIFIHSPHFLQTQIPC